MPSHFSTDDLRGRTALVTGATSGIGLVYATRLAEAGTDLVLVARSATALEEVAGRLAADHRVRAVPVAQDLARPGAGADLAARVLEQGPVDLLVNNAGFATYGRLAESDPARLGREVLLNVAAVADLTAALVAPMVARGHGAVVNVASTAAFQPVPYMATYGATKAFVLSDPEALRAELRGSGVGVQALCPGATDTAFFDVVGAEEASVGARMTPEAVVQASLDGLRRDRGVVIPGRRNWALAQAGRFLPRQRVADITERTMRPAAAPGA